MGSPISGSSLEISPRQWKITFPIVGLHSNYGTQTTVSFAYKTYLVEGVAKRLTLEQVESKYGRR
jgi:hypothetical protein